MPAHALTPRRSYHAHARRVCALGLLAGIVAMAAQAQTPRGNARNGELVYARCLACHTLEQNAVGPRHCGLFGRRAGSVAGFDYSPAMRRSNIVWDERTLDRFLTDPAKAVPGTSMAYAGLPDARERADLIAWLRLASMDRRCTAGAARDLQTHNASEAYSAGERR